MKKKLYLLSLVLVFSCANNNIKSNNDTKSSDPKPSSSVDLKDNKTLGAVAIKTDIKYYSNVMSSTVGIGLEPDYTLNRSVDSIIFIWKTNHGHFVNWSSPDFKVNELNNEVTINSLKKIYWTYSPDEVIPATETVKITLTLKDKTSNEVISSSFLELLKDVIGFKVK